MGAEYSFSISVLKDNSHVASHSKVTFLELNRVSGNANSLNPHIEARKYYAKPTNCYTYLRDLRIGHYLTTQTLS